MKKFLLKVKNDLFAYSFLFLLIFLFICFILALFNIKFRLWFIILMFIVFFVSLVIGIIQISLRESKVVKIVIIVLTGSLVLFCLFFYKLILFILAFAIRPEYVTVLDGKKYVAAVDQGFHHTSVSYYDYYGPFLRGTTERINGFGDYNPFIHHDDKLLDIHLTYYDKNGKQIYEKDGAYKNGKLVSENSYDDYDTEIKIPTIDDNVLYEAKFGKTFIRIRQTDSVMPQNMAISVYKSTDGGKNFEMVSDPIIVSLEASFIFLDKNFGFIISSGNVWLNKDSTDLYVTFDGGKTFKTANFDYTNDKVEYMSIVDYPYFKENVLHLECEVYLSKEKTLKLNFISKDNGLNWSLAD